MDYRCLIAVPLAALALSASSAESYRVPSGWQAGASSSWPASTTYLLGVAPESDNPGERTLTVQSVGKRQASELGAVGKASWATAASGCASAPRSRQRARTAGPAWWCATASCRFTCCPSMTVVTCLGPAPARAACADWCTVSAVADIPSDGMGAATVGVALIGNGRSGREASGWRPSAQTYRSRARPSRHRKPPPCAHRWSKSAWPRPPSPRRPATSTCTELVAPTQEPRHGLPRPLHRPHCGPGAQRQRRHPTHARRLAPRRHRPQRKRPSNPATRPTWTQRPRPSARPRCICARLALSETARKASAP